MSRAPGAHIRAVACVGVGSHAPRTSAASGLSARAASRGRREDCPYWLACHFCFLCERGWSSSSDESGGGLLACCLLAVAFSLLAAFLTGGGFFSLLAAFFGGGGFFAAAENASSSLESGSRSILRCGFFFGAALAFLAGAASKSSSPAFLLGFDAPLPPALADFPSFLSQACASSSSSIPRFSSHSAAIALSGRCCISVS
mmetsp:Transcript_18650/g.59899  ORF Transcript_18650/g.59899 Transcript_18650/m.59899 type:complete len:201 (-) Transcript_18650:218-820(-)